MAGIRVSLDSIVYGFLRRESAEAIQQSFPALKLEEVYGAITYYLANQKEIDAYLTEQEETFAKLKLDLREAAPLRWQRLQEARNCTQNDTSADAQGGQFPKNVAHLRCSGACVSVPSANALG